MIIKACFVYEKICKAQVVDLSMKDESEDKPTNKLTNQPATLSDIEDEDIKQIMKFKPALGESFWRKFLEMAKRISPQKDKESVMKVANIIAKVINSESGFNPTAVAKKDGMPVAKGLNGLLKYIFNLVAKRINKTDVSWDNLENISAEEQLPYVEGFIKMVGGVKPTDSPTTLYVKNFGGYHATNPKANGEQVLYAGKEFMEGHQNVDKFKEQKFQNVAYEQNKGFDVIFDADGKIVPDPNNPKKPKRKGYITPKDLEYAWSGKLRQGLAELAKRKV